ncbi:MAG: hypothetical protein QS98_C0010G0074 [archaeon GW2011_AR3]|nr:MAG: hypothetical protein QS98_C0010G0074 [archaeon GW2011_AR3]MBS3110214.1 hypothetical protein [Candidatus Woesearchaeota archaeon]
MKVGTRVEIRVFLKEDDDISEVKKGLARLLPFDIETEKIGLEEQAAEGFNRKKITIFKVVLAKDRHINSFIRKLFARFTARQKEMIHGQLESRIDEGMNFFLRLDKESLIKENSLQVTDEGNCYHITLRVAAYPRTKNAAKKVIQALLASS